MFSRVEPLVGDEEQIVAEAKTARLSLGLLPLYILAVLMTGATTAFFLFPPLQELVPSTIPPLSFAGGVIIAVGFVVLAEVKRIYTTYYFTNRKVIGVTGFINVDAVTIPFSQVTHTRLATDALGRLFAHGSLSIDTAGRGQSELVLKDIPHPGKYDELLGKHVEGSTGGGGATGSVSAIRADEVEAELGRIHRRRQALEQNYQNREISDEQYEQQWYVLQGEEQVVQRFLDQLGSDL